jgi:two-component system, OmpR family, copper resistance phosphate regulon response regulator CusR
VSAVLIAEDEERIAAFVEKGLRSHGFTTMVCGDGRSALELALSGGFDLLLLDVGLPLMDGFQVLAELRRKQSPLPVIVLTARGGISDTVAGLEGGADDYLVKPFRFEELLARIRVRLRAEVVAPSSVVTVGRLSLDLRTREVTAGERRVSLTAREFSLLEVFLRHPGQVLSREQLLSRVWGYDFDPGSNIVDVYVRQLRSKVGVRAIETVRGAGYRLVVH